MSQLRIFWPEDAPAPKPRPARAKTLSEFYRDYVLPVIRVPKGSSDATIEQDQVALRHWKRLTGDPPLDRISPELCARFMAELGRQGLSPSTIRKTAVHLQFILDHAGPPDRRHRNAARILDGVPYLERPGQILREPEPAFTWPEIEGLIEACKGVKHTDCLPQVDQPLWWASLVRFAWHTGLRRMNLLNARWSWLTADGWLVIPGAEYKQHKTGRRFYISSAARRAAERVRIAGEDRMFPWNGGKSYFQARWRDLTARLPENRRFGLKAIRRATLTWLAERNPLVSRLVAGHRKLDVLEDFYVQRDVVVNLLESMPVPRGWDV